VAASLDLMAQLLKDVTKELSGCLAFILLNELTLPDFNPLSWCGVGCKGMMQSQFFQLIKHRYLRDTKA
jgi:hypothetical protein